ncbi:MAG: ABC transporter ATP-binding protein/permease [Aestuariivita sp.]|nr:ABC transporter ATP-binding protein/permease [Aestuariivita sp.]
MNDTILQEERRSALRTIRKVAPYLWPHEKNWIKWRVIAALGFLLLSKIVAVTVPLFYKSAVDALSEKSVNSLVLGAVGLTVAYGIARLMNVGFQQLRDIVFAAVGQRALRSLALETFQHIHRLSLRFHISRKTGGLSRIIDRGIKGVDFLLRFLLLSIGPLAVELLFIMVVVTILLDFWYLFILAGTITTFILFTIKVTEWRVKIRRVMNDQDTEANQKAIDSLLNFETVKYFGAEKREAKNYDAAMQAYEQAALKTSYSLAFLNFGQGLLVTVGMVSVMVLAAIGVQNNTLTVGDFVMVNAYMIQITLPLNFLGTVYREIRQSLVDMSEMFDLLEQRQEVFDKPDAADLIVKGGRIELKSVRFKYEGRREILKGIDLTVEPGQKIAIVGATGSGKSTIDRLLFRFYDVTDGEILIDGQDIRDVTQASLHAAVGVVPQDTVLFNNTIWYNIAYGREDASNREVLDAARAAQIHDFIVGLPEGYDTQVGERGLKLSGGEKQRVGIARTLLKNPPILLLDEATSALDSGTEFEIKEAIDLASQGRTVVTIAHRLSTIVEADKIFVLEEGKVVEQGTHVTLLARSGRYAQLWNSMFINS